MSRDAKCSCCGTNIAIFPCSGAANVGQLANRIVIELEKKGFGNLMSIAGIGAQTPRIMKSAEASDKIIAIDGCSLNCASKTLELADFNADSHIVISELGIKKSKKRDLKENEVSEALEKTLEILNPNNFGLNNLY